MRMIRMLFTGFLSGTSHSHIFCQLANTIHSSETTVQVTAPAGNASLQWDCACDWAFSRLRSRLLYRLAGDASVRRKTEKVFLQRVRPGDVAYPWTAYSPDLCRRLADKGAIVVAEMINSHLAFAREILEPEFARLGVELPEIYKTGVAGEYERLEAADFIFSPSPFVTASLRQHSVPEAKIIESSYGFQPGRLTTASETLRDKSGPVEFLFIGLLCIRKGVPRLLDCWNEAKPPNSRLTLVGAIADDLPSRYREMLATPTVRWLPHTKNVAEVYRNADVFVFPSLEEGSPLVTYEAAACGLPCIVSEAGAGGVVRDGVEGFVAPYECREMWVDLICRLATDVDLRREMSQRAKQRAAKFEWGRVGSDRRTALQTKLDGTAAGAYA